MSIDLDELKRYTSEDIDIAVTMILSRKTEDPIQLEAKAILVTELRERGIWPPKRKVYDQEKKRRGQAI